MSDRNDSPAKPESREPDTTETSGQAGYDDPEKRRLIDSLEAMRGPDAQDTLPRSYPRPEVARKDSGGRTRSEGGDESQVVTALRDQLRVAQATCALMGEEIQRLERKALRAIAEAGQLRRQLDEIETERAEEAGRDLEWSGSKMPVEIRRCLVAARDERKLLTRALSDSECEIARLTKTMDLLVRKLSRV